MCSDCLKGLRRGTLALFSIAMASSSLAQDNHHSDLMIVLDASGSMWGQVDGTAKIEIARDVFSDLSYDLVGTDQAVGLIAYGHRRRGDCSDIELLALPGQIAPEAMSRVVNGLRPLGKTPLSDAVRLAAEELKFTENAANVILLSDGRETCDADPCAVSAELESLGIDFTAHVIGFDITDEEARSQLQCIAANTGGQYLDAKNGDGLSDALRQIVALEEPAPPMPEVEATVTFNIQINEQEGTTRPDALQLRATNLATDDVVVLGALQAALQVIDGLTTTLPIGNWLIEAISDEGRGAVEAELTSETRSVTVPFSANPAVFKMIDTGPYQLGLRHQFYLNVEGKLQPNATYTVSLFPAGAVEFNERLDWESRFGSDATGITLHDFESPDVSGDYEILVTQSYDLSEAIARFPVQYASQVAPSWQGALQGAAGETIPIVIGGNTDYRGELTLTDQSNVGSSYAVPRRFGPEGPTLSLPASDGVYNLSYTFVMPAGDLETIAMGQINVGAIQREDDADAVVEPPRLSEGLSTDEHVWEPMNIPATADPALLRLSEEGDFVSRCRDVTCTFDDPATGLQSISLLGGFALLEPILNEDGRPTIEIINEFTGEWVALNPIRQTDQTTECVDVGVNGPSATTPDTAIDLLCAVKGGNGYTQQMMDTLGAWATARNAVGAPQGEAADTMMSPEEEAAEATLLAEPHPLEPLLRTWTVIDPTDIVPVGLLKFAELDPDNVSAVFLLQNGAKLDLEEQRFEASQVDVVRSDTGQITLITLTLPTLGVVQLIPDGASDPDDPVYQGILLNPNKGCVLNVKVI